jgi:hypothetical protein
MVGIFDNLWREESPEQELTTVGSSIPLQVRNESFWVLFSLKANLCRFANL